MSIDLALQPWPALISAVSAFAAVLVGHWWTRRGEKKKSASENLKWIITLVTSDNPKAQAMGVTLLEALTDEEKVVDEDVQRQALLAWQAYLEEEVPAYDESEDEIVVEPGEE